MRKDRLVPTCEEGFTARAVDRLLFFSDAVAAVAITLLAIDLPVPRGGTLTAFWSSARADGSHYAAFLISFAVIAGAWSHHHDVFRYVVDLDPRLRQLNMAWLLMVILVPFATRLLTGPDHATYDVHAVRFGLYALLEAMLSATMLLMVRYLGARGHAPDAPEAMLRKLTWQCWVLVVGFGLSIPLFFATSYAWVLWLVSPFSGRLSRARKQSGEGNDD
jgi:uncharacterized membrane protein